MQNCNAWLDHLAAEAVANDHVRRSAQLRDCVDYILSSSRNAVRAGHGRRTDWGDALRILDGQGELLMGCDSRAMTPQIDKQRLQRALLGHPLCKG